MDELLAIEQSAKELHEKANRILRGVQVTPKSGYYNGRPAVVTSVSVDNGEIWVFIDIFRVQGNVNDVIQPQSRMDGRRGYRLTELFIGQLCSPSVSLVSTGANT